MGGKFVVPSLVIFQVVVPTSVHHFVPANCKLHPACSLSFRITWFATDNQFHIGSLFICFMQCLFLSAIIPSIAHLIGSYFLKVFLIGSYYLASN
ncbi:hypothetical protein SORBI_3003G192500 [Sorghum bicolor]|uniref:Uncharacterized protein n=1 Tax=Sorghum bicolor TaxID=4558 RepID=A0A1B6Q4E0_SORBI|nr:hypothetical protein SORBI_3003G192500 [Sorghum bicolor]